MINKDFNEDDSFDLLTIAEVATRLKSSNDSATRWLKEQCISIHKLPKRVVYKIEVDCAISKPLLIDLKRKYPSNWGSIFVEYVVMLPFMKWLRRKLVNQFHRGQLLKCFQKITKKKIYLKDYPNETEITEETL